MSPLKDDLLACVYAKVVVFSIICNKTEFLNNIEECGKNLMSM